MSRRTLLAVATVAALGAVAWGGANLLEAVRGGARRFTGSRFLPSGGVPPPTTFYGEGTPVIDRMNWRLAVEGRVARPLSLDLGELTALGSVEQEATLDCTSGWAMLTRWRGVPLTAVLDAAGADSHPDVTVESVTGWLVRLDRDELEDCLLATEVAGAPLPAANGAPCRLVVPSRRGLDWIKWVDTITVV